MDTAQHKLWTLQQEGSVQTSEQQTVSEEGRIGQRIQEKHFISLKRRIKYGKIVWEEYKDLY